MPFALLIIGLLMIITGARDTHRCFAAELQSDFTGPPNQNFIWWVAALGGIGAIGYIHPSLRGVSNMLLALVLIVMVIAQHKSDPSGGGFFGRFVKALENGPEKIDPSACAPASSNVSDPFGALGNLFTPFANSGTVLGKYLDKLKPVQSGGSGH